MESQKNGTPTFSLLRIDSTGVRFAICIVSHHLLFPAQQAFQVVVTLPAVQGITEQWGVWAARRISRDSNNRYEAFPSLY